MQTGNDQLKRQQLILRLKGFYTGAVDGIWSSMTIEAKQKWERSRNFVPAIPNNGLPFASKGPYPSGIRVGKDGMLTCAEVEEFLEREKLSQQRTFEKKKVEPASDDKE